MVAYATLTAPFDGIVTRRRINTGDFVQPPPGGTQDPLYVIQRRDVVRIFVEVPEADAAWVKEGTPARIEIAIRRDLDYSGTVRRISYSLKRQTRTLLAEIDFPNPEDALRPGMYAAATLQVERPDVLTLPAAAVASEGSINEGYRDNCYVLERGKLRRMRIELGARGEDRVQVLRKEIDGKWTKFNGGEDIVLGDLAALSDGQEVHVARQDRTNRTSMPSMADER
jgi:RND family efflux transporter MFP subunit